MQTTDDLGFIHEWVPAELGSSDPVTLLLLHGAGGDDNALLPVGKKLWPGAALLALRGRVLENDLSSSFGRFTEADIGDLKSRTEELAQFIEAASKRYGFRRRRLIVVGYANGANLAASLILRHPHYLAGAVLFRAMLPLVPDLIRDFSHLSIFIGADRLDPLIPSGQAEELAALFESGGADVTISWHQGGRELGDDDIQAAKHWLARENTQRKVASHANQALGHEKHGYQDQPPKRVGAHSGRDQHAGHAVAQFRDKFWLSLALTLPVVFWSGDVQHWLDYHAPTFAGSRLIPAILGTIILVYGGSVFIQGARHELSAHQPGMMSLISLALVVAFTASIAATLGFFEVDVWWELSTLITVMLLGHWLEMRATAQARGALDALAALLPNSVERITETGIERVPLAELRIGDVVLVRPGSRVPADGSVLEGNADVDESLITGESRAIPKAPGAAVVGGTVTEGGSLRVRVKAVGEQTALSGIMRLVAAAQASGSHAQALAGRAAALLFYVAVAAGTLTFAYWWLAGDREHALIRTATVLVIACPHALGLAIPLVIAISTSIGARNGLLVRDRLALERARSLDVVIFDKTGTLTRGAPVLSGVAAVKDMDEREMLALASAVEADSEHPIARAIVSGAVRRGIRPESARDFEALPGRGTHATVSGQSVAVGGPRLLADTKATIPPELDKFVGSWVSEGRTVLYVIRGGAVIGVLAVEDEIRPESADAVKALHELGVRVAMITGDSQAVATSVAKRLGIDDVAAQVLPADKASAVERFRTENKTVAMVGDGVNDAPALATADVGIAIGAGTDVAVESAGIVLVRSDPRDVVRAIELSRATYRKMVQNLLWATVYNVIAIPAAAGMFIRWGLNLPMSVGAIAMNLSTIIVAFNAQLLRRLKLGH